MDNKPGMKFQYVSAYSKTKNCKANTMYDLISAIDRNDKNNLQTIDMNKKD